MDNFSDQEPEGCPGLDKATWARWVDYRKQIGRTLKRPSIPAAQKELASYGADQAAVVDQSIAQGWQGLFALKAKPFARQPDTKAADREKRQFEELKQRAERIGFRQPLEAEDLIGYRTLVEREESRQPRRA